MFRRNLITKKIVGFFTIAFMLLFILGQFQVTAQKSDRTNLKPEIINGRIFAQVNSLVLGAGVGPKFQTFIFESVEQDKVLNVKSCKLFRIMYEYFDKDKYLNQNFFDRQILYELKVVRKQSCDAKLSEFAYEQNGDTSPPTSILNLLDGADKNLLIENQVLPCYLLSESNYKIINE